MSFIVKKHWEDTGFLSKLTGSDDTRLFPVTKLVSNTNMFLVDIQSQMDDEDGITFTDRYFFTDILEALDFITSTSPISSRITLLSRRCDNEGQYVCSDIDKVVRGKDQFDQPQLIIQCQNGRNYSDRTIHDLEGQKDNLEIIYFQSNSVDLA